MTDYDDELHSAWVEASHVDTWNVRVVYEATFRELVAGELERLAEQYELNAREADDRVRNHLDFNNQTGATIATVTSEINDAVADHLRERALDLRGES